jgi:molybdenum cofactor synthesis domain-containing protein
VAARPSAAIVTIGNELVSGDVENSNGSFLARRLEQLGFGVRLIVAVPDEIEAVAEIVREQAARADVLVVTGGLGGTPDDLTREAVAHAFAVAQEEVAEVAADLRARFTGDPEYAARWALLPAGSRPVANPLGGAPGFVIENVYVLPGLPSEMEAMFESIAGEIRQGPPLAAWRAVYRARESTLAPVLVELGERHPTVLVGSYPAFHPHGPEVEIVVKSSDPEELAAAVSWFEHAIANIR